MPASETLFAVDLSFSQITDVRMAALKARGVELVIQGLWTGAVQPAPRVTNLRIAKDHGVAIAGYFALNAQSPGEWHYEQARAGVPLDLWNAQRFCAVDVELAGIELHDILAAGRRTQEDGFRPTCYTSRHAWMELVVPRNPTTLAEMDWWLWNAFWDADPDFDFAQWPFGGWKLSQVVGEQWSGGVDLEGVHVDRNTFVRSMIFPTEGGEPVPDLDQRMTTLETQVANYKAAMMRVSQFQEASAIFAVAAAKALGGAHMTPSEEARIRFLLDYRPNAS